MGDDDRVRLSWASRAPPVGSTRPASGTGAREVDLYFPGGKSTGEVGWTNALYRGDNLHVLEHLNNAGLAGTIDMIYIDPPFFTGLDFKATVSPGKRKTVYNDTWQDGLPGYLGFMEPRLRLMHELLADNGSMYVHLDWHVSHYIKVLLDEIFGYEHFRNQIIWKRLTYKQTQVKSYGVLHDVILFYTKGKVYTWNDSRVPYNEDRLRRYFRWVETPGGENVRLSRAQVEGNAPVPAGRRFALNPVINPNPDRPNLTYEFLGFTKVWKYTREKMNNYHDRGIVFQPSPGALPQKKQYLDESPGMKLNDIFLDVGAVMGGSAERVGFDTQKPTKLLSRLVEVSTNPGDLVADFFAGSGTTLAVAESLGRRWIGCELSPRGAHTTRKRLLAVPTSAAFSIKHVEYPAFRAWREDPGVHRRLMLGLLGAGSVVGSTGDGLVAGVKDGTPVHVVPFDTLVDTTLLRSLASRCLAAGLDDAIVVARRWLLDAGLDPATVVPGVRPRCIVAPAASELLSVMTGRSGPSDPLLGDGLSTGMPGLSFFHVPRVLIREAGDSLVLQAYELPAVEPGGVPLLQGEPASTLDYAAFDWHHEPGGVFKNGWCTFTSRQAPPFSVVAPLPSSRGIVALRVVDVLGHESTQLVRTG